MCQTSLDRNSGAEGGWKMQGVWIVAVQRLVNDDPISDGVPHSNKRASYSSMNSMLLFIASSELLS